MTNELNFKGNSTTEWREYSKIIKTMFWDDFETRRQKEAHRMIQDQINEEFQMQIGASWHEKGSPDRRMTETAIASALLK